MFLTEEQLDQWDRLVSSPLAKDWLTIEAQTAIPALVLEVRRLREELAASQREVRRLQRELGPRT